MATPLPPGRTARPFTLKALCGLLFFRGLMLLVVVALIALELFYRPELVDAEDLGLLTGVSAYAYLVGYAALALSLFVTSVGLWRLRPWAWRLTMILVGGMLLYGLWVQYGGGRSLTNAIGLLLNIFIVFYLVQGDIRALFVEDAGLVGDA